MYTKKDLLLDILITIAVMAGLLVYWVFTLFLISLILINVWKVSWEQILVYAGILWGISSVVYVVNLIRKRRNGK